MPSIDLSILNQRQTPAFYADTLANRPAAGFVGRIFVSTDTFAFFRDNGTGWDLIGGPGTGTVTGSGAAGQVSFWNGANTITGSNDLFWDNVNGHLGVGTVTPGTALDVKHDQNTVLQLEQITATNDIRIAFINSGVGLWRIGSFYNAGANDFGIFDVVGAIQPVTVKKTTGQVLIGTSTVGTGKLTVASATGDNHIQIVGATSPSLRIDSAESGPTKRIGLGLATAVNNFIQNSQNLDMCIFNGSTSAAGNMLFGIYDTGLANVQEAARISSARNFLIGTITDTGQKLQVSGTALITGAATFNSSVTTTQLNATTTISGYAAILTNTNGALDSNGLLVKAGTSSTEYIARFANQTDTNSYFVIKGNGRVGVGIANPPDKFVVSNNGAEGIEFGFNTGSVYMFGYNRSTSAFIPITMQQSGGNVLIGTTTDNGFKLQVQGNTSVTGTITADRVRTDQGSVSANNATPTTLFTVSGNSSYLVYANVPAGAGDPNNYTSFATVLYDGSAGRIIANSGGVLALTLSGANVQGTQGSGGPQNISYTFLRIA